MGPHELQRGLHLVRAPLPTTRLLLVIQPTYRPLTLVMVLLVKATPLVMQKAPSKEATRGPPRTPRDLHLVRTPLTRLYLPPEG